MGREDRAVPRRRHLLAGRLPALRHALSSGPRRLLPRDAADAMERGGLAHRAVEFRRALALQSEIRRARWFN